MKKKRSSFLKLRKSRGSGPRNVSAKRQQLGEYWIEDTLTGAVVDFKLERVKAAYMLRYLKLSPEYSGYVTMTVRGTE